MQANNAQIDSSQYEVWHGWRTGQLLLGAL